MNAPKCPICGSLRTCPILYEYPRDVELYLEAVAKGEIIEGGCVISESSPEWHCHDCSNEWKK